MERWNWDFLMRAVLGVTSRKMRNFHRGLRIFEEIKIILSVAVEDFS